MPRDAVLDASALLALLNAEPGAQRVAACIPGGIISAVNLAAVVGKLAETGMTAEDIRMALSGLGLRIADMDEKLAYEVGMLRPSTRSRGLSLGDRACLAQARKSGLPAVTADREWLSLDVGVEVEAIR